MSNYGFNDNAWEKARAEGKAVLAECARARHLISYSDFIMQIRAIPFTNAHDPRLAYFLEEISVEEAHAGRGMLTALVVYKHGEHKPGPGFFELEHERIEKNKRSRAKSMTRSGRSIASLSSNVDPETGSNCFMPSF